MPALAAAGEPGSDRPAVQAQSPASGGYTPVSSLISVDLPAPFWPIRAWTSPAKTRKSTPRARAHR